VGGLTAPVTRLQAADPQSPQDARLAGAAGDAIAIPAPRRRLGPVTAAGGLSEAESGP